MGGRICQYNYMSGHSKWATIHRAKEINDGKKGAVFTKMAQIITLAVKQGKGVDEAISRAKQVNMPKDNIQRAIDRGMGSGDADNLTEVLYEAFGPGGISILVSAVTDNKLRTAQQIYDVVNKGGGSMGNSGSVSYLFSHQGEIVVKTHKPKDEAELEIIDLGVDDVEEISDGLVVYCDKEKTFVIKGLLEKLGYEIISTELVMRPSVHVEVAEVETSQKLQILLEKLEDLDDVQKVWSNYSYA